jgi:hypothetical protein
MKKIYARFICGSSNKFTASCILGLVALWPTLAFAHGNGLFFVFFGIPLAAISFLIAAVIFTKFFVKKLSLVYWVAVFFCFFIWKAIYISVSLSVLDGGLLNNIIASGFAQEQIVSVVMALLPIVICVLITGSGTILGKKG